MHDLSYFREHLELFEQMARNRGIKLDVAGFRALDRERRESITAVERLKAERNKASDEIARRKRAGEDASALLTEMKRVSEEIAAHDVRVVGIRCATARIHAHRPEYAAQLSAGRPRREQPMSKSAVGAHHRNLISLRSRTGNWANNSAFSICPPP